MPWRASEPLADRVYIDQVRSLFLSLTPSVVMSGVFLLNFCLVYRSHPSWSLLAIGIAGCLANAIRVATAALLRRYASSPAISLGTARRLEIYFSVPYVAFAAVLGAFSFWVVAWAETKLHMLTICAVMGYCAGVATSCGLRPRLATGSILLAIGPTIAISLVKGDATYVAMAVMAGAFVAGATRWMLVRFNESKTEIGTRLNSAAIARCDVLTGLPNRLALQEYFDERRTSSAASSLAVHYLDLNGFKPVNDRLGHAVGDELLVAVAGRLRGAVRSGDIVARLGGDEFAIIQSDLRHDDEAELLCRRIEKLLARPFRLREHSVPITASIGTFVSQDQTQALDALLQLADEGLYLAKRSRANVRLRAI